MTLPQAMLKQLQRCTFEGPARATVPCLFVDPSGDTIQVASAGWTYVGGTYGFRASGPNSDSLACFLEMLGCQGCTRCRGPLDRSDDCGGGVCPQCVREQAQQVIDEEFDRLRAESAGRIPDEPLPCDGDCPW